MQYRILWTWDSWVCDPFSAESYVSEFGELIDFMAEWGYNGLVIWGFIDSRHGGEEAAREVASHGARAGVRVMPGIGAGGYEGFVTSGDHPYSVSRLLADRPDLRAYPRCDPGHPDDNWLCLYHPDAVEWLRAGARWLADGFEIGGVNIETNESGFIDVCDRARGATAAEPNRLRYAASFADLSIAVPAIHEEITTRRPDAWITYAAYEPPWWKRTEDLHLLRPIPPGAIAQWNMEMESDTAAPPPVANNVSLIHSGGWSYHLASFPPIRAFTQYRCFYPNLEEARQFAANQWVMGTQGFVLGNAGSHKCPGNEIAYVAHVEFARNPGMTVDEFSRRFISRLYGDEAEPLVKRLVLAQPRVHRSVVDLWKFRVSGGVHGNPGSGLSEDAIRALEDQVELAHRAREKANEVGVVRLDRIIEVLQEYLEVVRSRE